MSFYLFLIWIQTLFLRSKEYRFHWIVQFKLDLKNDTFSRYEHVEARKFWSLHCIDHIVIWVVTQYSYVGEYQYLWRTFKVKEACPSKMLTFTYKLHGIIKPKDHNMNGEYSFNTFFCQSWSSMENYFNSLIFWILCEGCENFKLPVRGCILKICPFCFHMLQEIASKF